MNRLSFVEVIAVLFAGLAGLASGIQAYVSWETRGEVSRAIVFAQRIDACARVMAAIEPFVAKSRADGRALVASGTADGRYSLPNYYYGGPSGNAAFDARHDPLVDKWRVASAAFLIVSPDSSEEPVAYFDRVITKEIGEGRYMTQAEMVAWLQKMDTNAQVMLKDCRGLL
jgi:hypothetical protein